MRGVVGYSSYSSNVLDVAPANADVAYSVSNTFAAVPGVVGTLLSGLLLSGSADPARDWRRIFVLSAAVYAGGCAVWLRLVEGAPVPSVNGGGRDVADEADE